ncbi:MAG TPA: hypothetical protein VLV86_10445, partial [Vicinamibacterales bacterium]|nr:hypothetical protein [Vicinamibacterales bacterium]
MPTQLRVAVQNNTAEPVRIRVDVLNFDAKRTLRRESFVPTPHALAARAATAVDLFVNQPFADRRWRYVVAIQRVETATGVWTHE